MYMLRVSEGSSDPANDQMRYRVASEDRVFEACISGTAKTLAKPSPEQRIKDWFDHHRLPEAGTSIRIPDYHFDPRYRQPAPLPPARRPAREMAGASCTLLHP